LGVDTLDTASAYGESEAILGRTIKDSTAFRIISKLPSNLNKLPCTALKESLLRLKISSIYGFLLHSYSSWEENPSLLRELSECQKTGLVKKIGISLYYPEEAENLMDSGEPLDIVQVPYSLLDRRFERVFSRLVSYGCEIHVRSVFLQGILLMEVDSLPDRFEPIHNGLVQFHNATQDLNVDIATLCLGFTASNPYIAKTVIGIESLENLEENYLSFEKGKNISSDIDSLPNISTTDEKIILPFNW